MTLAPTRIYANSINNKYDNKHAYAGKLNSFTHIRALLVLYDRVADVRISVARTTYGDRLTGLLILIQCTQYYSHCVFEGGSLSLVAHTFIANCSSSYCVINIARRCICQLREVSY